MNDETDTATPDERLRSLYRALSSERAPAHLDALIVGAAQREVTPARGAATPFGDGWTVPVSLAATVLLAAGLVALVDPGTGRTPASPTAVEATPAVPRASTSDPAPVEQRARTSIPSPEPGHPDRAEPGDAVTELLELRPQVTGNGVIETPGSATPERRSTSELDDTPVTIEFLDHPALWLAFIERLVERDQIDEARTHLRAFEGRHPDHPVPDSLAHLLPGTADGS